VRIAQITLDPIAAMARNLGVRFVILREDRSHTRIAVALDKGAATMYNSDIRPISALVVP